MIFLSEKTIIILILLKEGKISSTEIHKKTDITYSHVHKMLNSMNDMGLVNKQNIDGRSIAYNLTKKGRTITDHLVAIQEALK